MVKVENNKLKKEFPILAPSMGEPLFDLAAVIEFDNGAAISVISGRMAKSNLDKPYEVAVFFNKKEMEPDILKKIGLHYFIVGFQNSEDITSLMRRIQELESRAE